MRELIELVNEATPLYPPFGRLAIVAAILVAAFVLVRVARRGAARLVDRTERRHTAGLGPGDTGALVALKQRQTALALVRTSVTYFVFALAAVLVTLTLVGADRIGTVVGASLLAVLIAFSAQRFLTDVIAGLLMFFEGWFRIGDTITIEPWKVQGVVEGVSLRTITIRGLDGEVMRVSNSEVKATRVSPRGFREVEIEMYVGDLDDGVALLRAIARIVPVGGTHFVRRPVVEETEQLDDGLARIRARAAVAPGREWLADDFLPSLVKERAGDGLLVHGPVVTHVDDHASTRFARASRTAVERERPLTPVA